MYDLDDAYSQEEFFLDHDSAVLQALQSTDKGLFDTDYSKDEDLAALYDH
ncbi:MAG: hypothetical protein AAF557_05070 [Pseudomonadota bacterium]